MMGLARIGLIQKVTYLQTGSKNVSLLLLNETVDNMVELRSIYANLFSVIVSGYYMRKQRAVRVRINRPYKSVRDNRSSSSVSASRYRHIKVYHRSLLVCK